MNATVLYDSTYGNTEKIAQRIGKTLAKKAEVTLMQVRTATSNIQTDLLVVGSPTQGGRPTKDLQTFLEEISPHALKDTSIAAFDTRFLEKDQKFALRLLMKTIGYAAEKIAKILEKKGGKLVVPPVGFIVKDTKGPLQESELERAEQWAEEILRKRGI